MLVLGQDNPNLGPEGHGYGVVKVDGYGRVSFAGTLADGAKVSQKVPLSKNGRWPLHSTAYSGQGGIHGWLTLTNGTTNDIRGTLAWARPALPKERLYPDGFTSDTTVLGSLFIRPANSTNRVLNLTQTYIVFSGGNLSVAFTNAIVLSGKNQVTNRSDNKLSLSISTSSGLFSGTVLNPATDKSSSFRGAVLQNQVGGGGFLLGTNRSARVSFGLCRSPITNTSDLYRISTPKRMSDLFFSRNVHHNRKAGYLIFSP